MVCFIRVGSDSVGDSGRFWLEELGFMNGIMVF